MCACKLSRYSPVKFFATLWTVACQGPLPMGFSRQEYWSGLPCPPPGDLPHPGIKSTFLMPPALAGEFFTPSATWEAPCICIYMYVYTHTHTHTHTHTMKYYSAIKRMK